MELRIDIPDEFYKRAMSENGMSYTDAEVVVNAFYKGTPLQKGRWGYRDTALAKSCVLSCSNCGYMNFSYGTPYCPNCGAQMEVENNDN